MQLMPEQVEDASRIAGGSKLIFSAPGTGKTLTALEGAKQLVCDGGVVICPPNATMMWEQEITTYMGNSVQRIKKGSDELLDVDWYVLSYQIAYGPMKARLAMRLLQRKSAGQRLVGILDEGHMAKGYSNATSNSIYGRNLDGRGGIFGGVTYPLVLTGTPILRYNDDLFNHLKYCYPEELLANGLQTVGQFRKMFCVEQLRSFHPRQRPTLQVVASRNNDMLKYLLSRVGMIRRTFNEMEASLPPLVERTILTPVGNMSGDLAAMANLDMDAILRGLAADDPIMAMAWQDLGKAKAPAMIEYIAEEATLGAVLVGVWHRELGDILEQALADRNLRVGRVVGGMTPEHKEKVRTRFNDGKYDVLVGQMRSMNTAWNLQAHGSHIIMAEDHWSPGLVEQFYKRVYRLGQESTCQLDFLKSDHPIDEAITKSREGKAASHAVVLGGQT